MLLLSLTFIVMSVFCFGCGGGEEDPDESNLTPPYQGKQVIYDFEGFERSHLMMRLFGSFGVINYNDNADYVKSGSASAELRPLGPYGGGSAPVIYAPFKSTRFGFDHTDLTWVRMINAQMYNASSEPVNVRFGIVTEEQSVHVISKLNPEAYSLEPGKWTELTIKVDLSIIDILYDHTKVQGVFFEFDNVNFDREAEIEQAPTLYLDDISLYYGETPLKSQNLLELDTYEICSFDKLYQQYTVSKFIENPAADPDVSVVDLANEIPGQNSNKVLKVVTKATDPYMDTWQKVVFPEGLMKASYLTKIPVKEIDQWQLSFTVYGKDAASSSLIIVPEIFSDAYNECWNLVNVNPSITGSTLKIPLSRLKEEMVTNPGFFRIAWNEYLPAVGENLTFYLDDIKVEKIAD